MALGALPVDLLTKILTESEMSVFTLVPLGHLNSHFRDVLIRHDRFWELLACRDFHPQEIEEMTRPDGDSFGFSWYERYQLYWARIYAPVLSVLRDRAIGTIPSSEVVYNWIREATIVSYARGEQGAPPSWAKKMKEIVDRARLAGRRPGSIAGPKFNPWAFRLTLIRPKRFLSPAADRDPKINIAQLVIPEHLRVYVKSFKHYDTVVFLRPQSESCHANWIPPTTMQLAHGPGEVVGLFMVKRKERTRRA
eukprot:gnl/Trimastix_PCT/885.p1 GENE.gnl/Trimastix_PCT/885~~gnl/Trimastix_PCT/885.p1  ORF type:complete len:251 (+),score=21.43 gnl/Trimastix_PCT/885:46-798(+)